MENRWLIIFLVFILSIALISSSLGTFKKNDCISIVTSLNVTSVNLDGVTSPNGTIIITDKVMTKNGNYFNYTFCDTPISGVYTYGFSDSDGNSYSNDFEVTNTGETFTIQISIIYILALVFLILLMLGSVYMISGLPKSNTPDEQGNIVQISWLKYFRPVLWIIVWALGLAVLFILSNIGLAYMQNEMIGKLFFVLWQIGFWFTIIGVPIYLIWIFVSIFQDKEMKKLIERGVEIKSTP